MGGDGTFAEVAKGILASGRAAEVRLAMLPTGTANDQGKSFGLDAGEPDLPRNVRVIAEGHEARLDVGRLVARDAAGAVVRDDWFFDSAGWGISPRVLSLRNEDRKAIGDIPLVRDVWRDQLVYAGALLRTFLGSYVDDDKFDVRVTADGATHEWRGLTDLIVKGTRIYGGLWVFDPDARPDDGHFEVVPFVGKRDWVSKAIVHLDGSGAAAEALATVGVRHSDNLSASLDRARLRRAARPAALRADRRRRIPRRAPTSASKSPPARCASSSPPSTPPSTPAASSTSPAAPADGATHTDPRPSRRGAAPRSRRGSARAFRTSVGVRRMCP